MPEIASLLLRKGLGSVAGEGDRCSSCRRRPLAGELLHEMRSGGILCDLCLVALPEEDRQAVRSERVHASRRHVASRPKVA